MSETIIETKSCRQCGNSFTITDEDMAFYEKISPTFGDKKYLIPTPTKCPDCRMQQMMSFSNLHKLYTSEHQGKKIISPYTPQEQVNVMLCKERFGDENNALDYGRQRDSTQSLFAQWRMLQQTAPRWDRITLGSENCDRCQNVDHGKNCYFVKSSYGVEQCYYSDRLIDADHCIDCHLLNDAHACYDVIDGETCHEVVSSQKVKNCSYSAMLFDCENCSHCLACAGLRNQEYMILNKKVSPTEFLAVIQSIQNDTQQYASYDQQFARLKESCIRRDNTIVASQGCIGDEIFACKECVSVFSTRNSQHCKYILTGTDNQDTYDCFQPDLHTLAYMVVNSYQVYHSAFCNNSAEVTNSYYCDTCIDIKHCFACVGLHNKSYCILNTQYTQEEYEALVPKILQTMQAQGIRGEFFPASMSPFGYNETLAMEHFPLTKEEALKQGFRRSDYEAPFPRVEKTLQANELPPIQELSDDILQQAIICEVTGKPFKLLKQELDFYRKHTIPLPHKHPDQRHKERIARQNPRKLWVRKCAKCGVPIQTTYAPERKEIVYCERCYNKEIYG